MKEGAEKGKSEKQSAVGDLEEFGLRLRVCLDSALGAPRCSKRRRGQEAGSQRGQSKGPSASTATSHAASLTVVAATQTESARQGNLANPSVANRDS